MIFDTGTWWLVGILLTVLMGVIGALISRSVFGKLDENSKDIKQIQKEYTPRADHTKDITDVRKELKADIKTVKDELRDEIHKLSSGIEDIKENCLRKDDFIRSTMGSDNKTAAVDRKLDKLIEMYIHRGGNNNG